MRLVTDDPMEYLAWIGISILGIVLFFVVAFAVAMTKWKIDERKEAKRKANRKHPYSSGQW